ncbi:protein NIM1-INTERACTING 1-like [Gastrolobium bilobum]|uniref:protein NIM1-INTERACTING 1-like n=1 Tax=Gastrolobium bilobum TaxID=150636 RepID=UPI002AAFB9CB|nr:protein NIM1-INTERACTING 1-like [Gastrolobium bilobum]
MKRKRKDDHGDDKDDEVEEEEEEMKMEKFYSLLRSFRDARDRRRKELEELEKISERKMKTEQPTTWVPCFEWSDFTNEVGFRRPPLLFPTPSPSTSPTTPATDKPEMDQHQSHSLDLNLAL